LHHLTSHVSALALARSHELFYLIVFTGSALEGSLTFVSGQAERFTGWSPDELVERPRRWVDRVHSGDLPDFARQTRDLLASKDGGVRRYRLQDYLGRFRHVEDTLTPLRDANGSIEGYFGVVRDVTAAAEADQCLLRLGAAFSHADHLDAVAPVTEQVAHRLRNVLTVVLGLTEATRDALDARGVTQPELREIDQAMARAEALVDQLVRVQRPSAGTHTVFPTTQIAALEPVLRAMIGSGVEVNLVVVAAGWPAQIRSQALNQLLFLLVARVKDTVPAGGVIDISVSNTTIEEPQSSPEASMRGDFVRVRVHGRWAPPSSASHRPGAPDPVDVGPLSRLVARTGGFVEVTSAAAGEVDLSAYLRRAANRLGGDETV
jgi:PAS domain S-box-containing protein